MSLWISLRDPPHRSNLISNHINILRFYELQANKGKFYPMRINPDNLIKGAHRACAAGYFSRAAPLRRSQRTFASYGLNVRVEADSILRFLVNCGQVLDYKSVYETP